jgi:peptidoglycan/xylan/chitin deacetylase (PgdA/CDA1 family)
MGSLKRSVKNAALVAAEGLGVNRLLHLLARKAPVSAMYHGVTDGQPVGFPSRHVTTAEFEAQLALFKKRFDVVSAHEWVEAIRRTARRRRPLLTLTFDDGYENNLRYAVPILKAYGMTACFFMTTGPIQTGLYLIHDLMELGIFYAPADRIAVKWQGRETVHGLGDATQRYRKLQEFRRLLGAASWKEYVAFVQHVYARAGSPPPPPQYRTQYSVLGESQVGEFLKQGMAVGSHTVTHAALAGCSDDEIAAELTAAARHIEAMTGLAAGDQLLAYPLGSYDARVVRIAREVGHPAAFAVRSGARPSADHLYELPRVGLYRGDDPVMTSAKLSGLLDRAYCLRARQPSPGLRQSV